MMMPVCQGSMTLYTQDTLYMPAPSPVGKVRFHFATLIPRGVSFLLFGWSTKTNQPKARGDSELTEGDSEPC